MAGLWVGQAYGVFHRPGFGSLVPVPRPLSTQPPFATQVLTLSNEPKFSCYIDYTMYTLYFQVLGLLFAISRGTSMCRALKKTELNSSEQRSGVKSSW